MSNYSFEIWKDIPEFEDLYQASSFGRIRSKSTITPTNRYGTIHYRNKVGVILKHAVSYRGYCMVCLRKDNKNFHQLVHRIIAQTFLPKPVEIKKPVVNHLDFNKENNNVSNLEWCSSRDNIMHAIKGNRYDPKKLGSLPKPKGFNSKLSKPYAAINIYTGEQIDFPSMSAVVSYLKVKSSANIYSVLNGKIRHTKGFTFKAI